MTCDTFHVACNTLHSRLLDSVDFVLCIDTVGAADEINLHVSRPLKDEITKRMYGALESAAADMQPPLPFALHQRKIDLGKNITGLEGWHHEVIPRSRPNLRLLAATLSSQSAFNAQSRASILDRHPPALKKMNRDFEFLTRAVSKMLYAPHASPTVLRSPAFLSSSEFIRVASETGKPQTPNPKPQTPNPKPQTLTPPQLHLPRAQHHTRHPPPPSSTHLQLLWRQDLVGGGGGLKHEHEFKLLKP